MDAAKEYGKSFNSRMENAQESFLSDVMEQFGLNMAQAEKVLRVFRKVKAVKYDGYMGRYNLTHGAFWDREVIMRAVES